MAQTAGEGIAILIDLPRWIRSNLDIADDIARTPAFRARSLDPAALARSPNDEPYLIARAPIGMDLAKRIGAERFV
jgi:hypothetical protein